MKRAKLYGKDCGPRFEVQFVPNRLVFRLPRKLARQRETRFHRFRSIVAVRQVPSVPVRCIEAASPSGLFLATRSFVLTHNSSLGRLGLLIHSTAGFIDPGWDGHVTLELSNVANLPITIYYGMKIGQLSFVQLTEPASAPYGSAGLGSKYQGQKGPTPSAYWRNFEEGSSLKVLVTGGYGFVGPKMVHALRARDHDVRARYATEVARRRWSPGAASSSRATPPTPRAFALPPTASSASSTSSRSSRAVPSSSSG